MSEIQEIADRYRRAGWEVPIPLPAGAKFPPPQNTTGGISRDVAIESAIKVWSGAENRNIALRAQIADPEWDILSLDVDDYDDKHGIATLQALETRLGKLPLHETLRSTRRGKDQGSAQYFFRVPRDLKWQAQVGPSIEMVQLTHRYAVVWPSEKDGAVYRWYLGDETLEIPTPDQALVLPEAWQKHLRAGVASLSGPSTGDFAVARRESSPHRAAMNWLRDNIPDFGTEDEMSSIMAKCVEPEWLAEEMARDAHDTMLRAIRRSVRSAVEGQGGLKIALTRIREAFVEETTNRSGEGRRSLNHARNEYHRALADEIEKLSDAISRGEKSIMSKSKEAYAVTAFRTSHTSIPPESNSLDFDTTDPAFDDTDAGNARLFVDYWGQSVIPTNETNNKEFAVWTPETGRYVFRGKSRMYRLIERGCSDRILCEADKIEAQASNLSAASESGQLPADADDPDTLMEIAAAMRSRASKLKNTVNANHLISQLHSSDEVSMEVGDFDSRPGLVGLGGAKTLDVNALSRGEEFIRPSEQTDLLTMSTKTTWVKDAKHPAWEHFLDKFLPDPEIRAFTQKVLGYTLFDGNPRKILVFLVGPSNTGKTTILEACAAALGDYATNMNANKLFANNDGSPNPEFVNNSGKLMVFLSEVGNTHRLSADTIKQITGGDRIQARSLYSNDTQSRTVRFTPYISTNTPPQISGGDAALLDRVVALPFNQTNVEIPDYDMDVRNNPEVRPAILAWLVEGALRFRDEGGLADRPDVVSDLGQEFMSETSLIQMFLSERTAPAEPSGDSPGIQELFHAWKSWCVSKSVDRMAIGDQVAFERQMRGLFRVGQGRRRTTRNGKKIYVYSLEITG